MAQIFPGLIVGLREGLEAFLIITVMMEYLKKIGRKDLMSSVLNGAYTGIGISFLLGGILWLISGTMQSGSSAVEKLWEAGASFIAVLFISYFIYWMIRTGKNITEDVKSSVNSNLSSKGLFALAAVAVAREGAEIALFAFVADNKAVYLSGNMTGIIIAAILALLIYKSLVKIDIRIIFKVTLIYLILQAAYLFGYSIHELLSALNTMGYLDSDNLLFIKVYNLKDTILDHKTGILGIILNVGIGWYSRPEIIQFVFQVLYLSCFLWFGKK